MAIAVGTLYEYKVVKVEGGGGFKLGQFDEKKTQEVLDSMSKDGWRLISAHVEVVSGTGKNLTCIWERARQ